MKTTTFGNMLVAAILLCACSDRVHMGQNESSDSGTGGGVNPDSATGGMANPGGETGGMSNLGWGTGGVANPGRETGGMANPGTGPSLPGADRFGGFTLKAKGPSSFSNADSTLTLDSATRRLSWKYWVVEAHGAQIARSEYRTLSEAEFAQIQASLAQVVVGSQPSCTQDGSFIDLDLEVDGKVSTYIADNDSSCVARPLGKTYAMNLAQLWSTVYDLSTKPKLSGSFDQLTYTQLAGADEPDAACGSVLASVQVDSATRQISWDECLREWSSSGWTGVSTHRSGSRGLSETEMALVRHVLESVQVVNLNHDCTDLANRSHMLDLSVGGTKTKYFNAYSCPQPPNGVPLALLGQFMYVLEPLARPIQMPTSYSQLVLSTDTPKDFDNSCAAGQRGYIIDRPARQFSTARCDTALGELVRSTTRTLTEVELSQTEAALGQVTVGVSGVCDTTRGRTTLDLLGPDGAVYVKRPLTSESGSDRRTVLASLYVTDADACEPPDPGGRTYVMHLDALEAVLTGLTP